jgi:glycosyltransferase involved in cell wall biosynthesis
MNSNPLVSILMPVRNSSLYLDECLQSIINQTEKHWELLAVDDHSSDHSFDILQKYAAKDHRIKVFKNKGKGIIHALRLAFENSVGELISRMDSDDIMKPQKITLLKKQLLKQGPGNVATAFVEYFSDSPLGDGYQKYQNWLNELTARNENFNDIYKECVIPSPCWMIFREDLLHCKAFDPDIYPEDYDLVFRFYKNDLKVTAVKEPLHLWRDYSERSSRTDPNYADQTFSDLKLKYFLELDYDKNQNLFLWGAGKKGKYLAKQFQLKEVPFRWISNNDQKTGKSISATILEGFEILKTISNPQIIITVAAPDDQIEIEQFLQSNNFEKGKHYYFFC